MRENGLVARIERSVRVAVGMATEYVLPAAVQMADAIGRPVMLIASRRQVDSPEFGGGYVGWSTPQWCARAAAERADGSLLLARDHAGPYQHPRDLQAPTDPHTAMANAIESLRCDIESGIELLHIDTSHGPGGTAEAPEVAIERAVALVTACVDVARAAHRSVAFEVGIEVQATAIADLDDFADQVKRLLGALASKCGVSPVFVVAQTGTKVTGRRNTGVIQRRPLPREHRERLHDIGALVRSLGSRLKAHNCDYLAVPGIRALHAADAWMNISPEIGVAQTLAVVDAARAAGLNGPLDAFCEATVDAGFWRKWAGDDAVPEGEKVALGGSYLFATPVFAELRDRLDRILRRRGQSTRRIAVNEAKAVAFRYAR